MPQALIEARGLRKSYAGNGKRVEVLKGFDLAIEAGARIGLIGNSGCGKSTLARLLTLLEQPDGGDILFKGQPMRHADGRGLRSFRSSVQIVFQDPEGSLNPKKRIATLLSEAAALRAEDPKEKSRAGQRTERGILLRNALASVGLRDEVLHRFPDELSGGQNQRIALARVLLLEPDFLILDEPTSGLDIAVQAQILHLVRAIADERCMGFLFISHDRSVLDFLCSRVFRLEEGILVH
jgi:ABC-type dipeptide/oligopeptide/nickel transport system ATPase subunit